MRAIVDADTTAYIAAWLAEGLDVSQAHWNVEASLDKLSARLNGIPMTLYLTGDTNFRYDIFPEYKAHRRDQPRPTHLQAVKDYLVDHHKAVVSIGCEADDLCGIDQVQSNNAGEETILAHIDKDLDLIPGKHYNPDIIRNGIVVRSEREYIISPKDALKNFYKQLLVGDSADGIKGAPGIGKVKAEKILEGLEDPIDLYRRSLDFFSCEEELLMNARLIWIWQKENDEWNIPLQTT